jgi:hypothetical protein
LYFQRSDKKDSINPEFSNQNTLLLSESCGQKRQQVQLDAFCISSEAMKWIINPVYKNLQSLCLVLV